MEIEFAGEVVEWRGPAPFFFVALPPDAADLVDEVKADVVYWGVVPVRRWIGTPWSLPPRCSPARTRGSCR